MTRSKKPWVIPQLIVLARGRPEEAVLGVCKGRSVSDTGPGRGGTCQVRGNNDCMAQGLT